MTIRFGGSFFIPYKTLEAAGLKSRSVTYVDTTCAEKLIPNGFRQYYPEIVYSGWPPKGSVWMNCDSTQMKGDRFVQLDTNPEEDPVMFAHLTQLGIQTALYLKDPVGSQNLLPENWRR